MNFKGLVDEGKIKRINASKEEIKDILLLADRDIKMAEFIITQDSDWAFSIAYNASLQASRAYMYSKGYRAGSNQAHKSTFEFMKIALGKEYGDMVDYFDRMRSKRNIAVYDTAGLITETEVKELLNKSKEFVQIIKGKLSDNKEWHPME
jgi:uncharacterized protein (UPF0332 family)